PLRAADLADSLSSLACPPSPSPFPYTTLFRSGSEETASASSRGEAPSARTASASTRCSSGRVRADRARRAEVAPAARAASGPIRSEEHTSELQSRFDLVCRLLLEKKHNTTRPA